MKEIIEFKKSFKAEIKSIDLENKTVTAVVSNRKKDREGDILPPEAFKKNLKNYKAHPVVLADHNYKTNSVIGQTKSIQIGDNEVEAKMEYFAGLTDKAGNSLNPTADWTWELCVKGLGAYSVGFKGLDFDWIKEKDAQGGDQITGRKFNEVELLEITHCAIPMHQDALQTMINDEKTDVELKGVCELVLKGLKSGEIKGPKLPTANEEPFDNDIFTDDVDFHHLVKEIDTVKGKDLALLIAKISSKVLKKSAGDDEANEQAQFDLMNKRIAAVETTVSQCQSLYAKLEGMINDLQDDIATLLETQQAASLGPKGTDVNEDPADIGNTPSKGYRHYSDALFGKPGSDKTKQLPEESQPATVSSRLKVLLRNKN